MGILDVQSVMTIVAAHATSLVAHQGGWDEFLLVAGPIAVIVGLLAIVKRRIDARLDSVETSSDDNRVGSAGDSQSSG